MANTALDSRKASSYHRAHTSDGGSAVILATSNSGRSALYLSLWRVSLVSLVVMDISGLIRVNLLSSESC